MKDKPVVVELFWEQCIGRFIAASANIGTPPLEDVYRIIKSGREQGLTNREIFVLLNSVGKEDEPWPGSRLRSSLTSSDSRSW